MGIIDKPEDFQVDLSSASFSRQGVKDTFAADVVKFLGDQGIKQFEQSRIRDADIAAKSLLEEFTGEKRLVGLARQEAEILQEEQGIMGGMSQAGAGPGEISRSMDRLRVIDDMKAKLERDREGVIQGLLSEDEYRKRAEMAFYQQVALTPGLKVELAQIMGESLGFDPRGQTAKITMEARRAMKEKQDNFSKKIITQLVDWGMYDVNMTEANNIATKWPELQTKIQAFKGIEELEKFLNAQETIDNAELRMYNQQARTWLAEVGPTRLRMMGKMGNIDLFNIDPRSVADFTPEVRAEMVNHINTMYAQDLATLSTFSTKGKTSYDSEKAAITARRDLLLSIVNNTALNEQLANDLSRLQTENSISVALEQQRLQHTYQEVVTMSALDQLVPMSQLLAVNSTVSGVFLRAIRGQMQDIGVLSAKEQDQALQGFEKLLSGVNTANWTKQTDQAVAAAGTFASTIARQDPDGLDDRNRQQLNKLAANKDFMDRLQALAPKKWDQIRRGVIQHQAVLGKNYNTRINETLDEQNLVLDSLDLHIQEASDGTYILAINTGAMSKLAPQRIGAAPLPGQDVEALEQAVGKREQKMIDERASALMMALHTPGLINNMVFSRANSMQITEEEAARQVAAEIGVSARDIETPERETQRPGFGAETGADITDPQASLDPNVQAALQIVAQTGADFSDVQEFFNDLRKNGNLPSDTETA